ncbi:hypothetical protein BH24ACT2_BH24ACT2_16670 [soil metagenome]
MIGTVAVLVTGNLAILAAFRLSRLREPEPTVSIDGIENVRVVDTKLWRGNAPSVEGYRGLAERGVSTVVDLRAERDLIVPSAVLDDIGIERVLIPIRDGQTPDPAQSARFMDVVREPRDGSSCIAVPASATGVMAATYLVEGGRDESPGQVLYRRGRAHDQRTLPVAGELAPRRLDIGAERVHPAGGGGSGGEHEAGQGWEPLSSGGGQGCGFGTGETGVGRSSVVQRHHTRRHLQLRLLHQHAQTPPSATAMPVRRTTRNFVYPLPVTSWTSAPEASCRG